MSKLPDIVPSRNGLRIVVEEVLKIGDDLDIEFRRQARLYARVSYHFAAAKKNVRRIKNELELITAKLHKSIAKRYRYKERLTVNEMQNSIRRKTSYIKKQKELEDAIFYEDILSGLTRALEHKKDALVSLGANARHEMPEELRMLSKSIRNKMKWKGE